MNILEAYELTLSKVKELRDSGIEINIIPYDRNKHSKEYIEELIKKYPDLPIDKWVQIKLQFNNPIEVEKITEANNYLSLLGIYFDRGGCNGYVDWEIDWSFNYSGKERMKDIHNTNELMDRIQNCNN